MSNICNSHFPKCVHICTLHNNLAFEPFSRQKNMKLPLLGSENNNCSPRLKCNMVILCQKFQINDLVSNLDLLGVNCRLLLNWCFKYHCFWNNGKFDCSRGKDKQVIILLLISEGTYLYHGNPFSSLPFTELQ